MVEDTPLRQYFWVAFIFLIPFFSGIVWIGKLNDCDERICFPYNGYYVNWKMISFHLS